MIYNGSIDWYNLIVVVFVSALVSFIVTRILPTGTARNIRRRLENKLSPFHLPHLQVNPKLIHSFQWLPPHQIRIHEHTIETRQSALYEYLNSIDSYIIVPCIIIDAASFTIIDGHHRFSVMQKLGWHRIPSLLLNYHHPDIITHPLVPIPKVEVVKAGRTKKTLPPKSTQHMVKDVYGHWYPIACLSLMVQYDPTDYVDVAHKKQLSIDAK